MTARIIILNGAGSVGKSSIAKALQSMTAEPFLHVQMDAFVFMLPENSFDRPEGLTFETMIEDGKPSVRITSGPVADRTFRGMRRAIAAMAGQGNNLIVDEVMLENEWTDYAILLADFDVSLIGVVAPLDVLESRELDREDRLAGLARWQYDRVHRGLRYDFEVDTSRATPMECATLIKQAFGL